MIRIFQILICVFITSLIGCDDPDKKPGDVKVENARVQQGEKLFKINCASCHKPDAEMVGPALKGAQARWGDKKLMYEFIRSSWLVGQKNEYAKKLIAKYNGQLMPTFTLTDDEIDAIMIYCEFSGETPVN